MKKLIKSVFLLLAIVFVVSIFSAIVKAEGAALLVAKGPEVQISDRSVGIAVKTNSSTITPTLMWKDNPQNPNFLPVPADSIIENKNLGPNKNGTWYLVINGITPDSSYTFALADDKGQIINQFPVHSAAQPSNKDLSPPSWLDQASEEERQYFEGQTSQQQAGAGPTNETVNGRVEPEGYSGLLKIQQKIWDTIPVAPEFADTWTRIFGPTKWLFYYTGSVLALAVILIISFALELFYFLRKNKSWGVVYDSATKRPLEMAAIRLFSSENKKLLSTHVTDKNGRFNFLAQPGTYYLEVSRSDYHFPSRKVTGNSDGYYAKVYNGGELVMKRAGFVSTNIPLDPASSEQKPGASVGWIVFTFLDYLRLPFLVLATALIAAVYFLGRVPFLLIFAAILAAIWIEEIYSRTR